MFLFFLNLFRDNTQYSPHMRVRGWLTYLLFKFQETINSFTPTFRAPRCGKFLLCYYHILLCCHGKWSKLDRWAWWFGWRDCCFCLGCNVYSCSTHMFWWTHTIYEWIFLNFYILNIYVYALFFNSSNFHVSVFGSRYSFDNPTNRNQKYVILHHVLPFLLGINANIIWKVA